MVYVADSRSTSAVEEYLSGIIEGSRTEVETVAMDMWQAGINAVDEHVPGSAPGIEGAEAGGTETGRCTLSQFWVLSEEALTVAGQVGGLWSPTC